MKNNEEYVANPDECPNCHSNNLSGVGESEKDPSIAWQKAECYNCGGIWTDTYKLIGFEEFKRGEQ